MKSFDPNSLTKEEKLNLIYRHTHRDYRGSGKGADRSILVLRGATCVVLLSQLTEAEIEDKMSYAIWAENKRLAKKQSPSL